MMLYDILWHFRQLWFFLSCMTLAFYAVRYKNYDKENQQLIDQINRKHKKLEIVARKCKIFQSKLQSICLFLS